MQIVKGLKRIGLIVGILGALIFLILYLNRTWRGVSFQEHRNPTSEEVDIAKLEANNENLFIWYRMLELDPHERLIADRSFEEQKTFPDRPLVRDLYHLMDFSPYDEYIMKYMSNHARQIHSPNDLSETFVYSIYLARTLGIRPEEAATNTKAYFTRIAAQSAHIEVRQFPWTGESFVVAFLGSGVILLAFWLFPSLCYSLLRALMKYISNGFK